MARAHINQESTTNDKSRLSRWGIIHLPDGWNRVRATERTATMEDGRAAGQPISNRAASFHRDKVRWSHVALPLWWFRSLAERRPWLPSPIAGDCCLHIRRGQLLELTNLIRPSYSSPDSSDSWSARKRLSTQAILPDMGLPRVRCRCNAHVHVVGCPTASALCNSRKSPTASSAVSRMTGALTFIYLRSSF